MKAFIIILVFLFSILLPIKSTDIIVENNILDTSIGEFGELYIELGTAEKKLSESISICVKAMVYKKKINSQTQKSFRNYGSGNIYRYNIVCVSSSKYNNQLTSTWLYGFWVRVNGVPITKPLYPRGKDIMIYTTPTIAHYIETEEEEIKVNIGWAESIPDPKIIK
jgi:hypothetical protein